MTSGSRVPFYISYFVPGCVLVLLVLAGETQRRGGGIFGNAAVHGGTGLILLFWLIYPALPRPALVFDWSFWLAIATSAVAAAAALRQTAAAFVVGVVLLSLCIYYTYDTREGFPFGITSRQTRAPLRIQSVRLGLAEWSPCSSRLFSAGAFLRCLPRAASRRPNNGACFIVKAGSGQALAYVYYEEEATIRGEPPHPR